MVWGDGGGGLSFLIYANSRSIAYAAVMLPWELDESKTDLNFWELVRNSWTA